MTSIHKKAHAEVKAAKHKANRLTRQKKRAAKKSRQAERKMENAAPVKSIQTSHPQTAAEPTKKQTAAVKAVKQSFGECKTKGKPPYSISLTDVQTWKQVGGKPLECPTGKYRSAHMYYKVSWFTAACTLQTPTAVPVNLIDRCAG